MTMNIIFFLNLKPCDPAFVEFSNFVSSIQEMEFEIWARKEYTLFHSNA